MDTKQLETLSYKPDCECAACAIEVRAEQPAKVPPTTE
jgi:hypothetical protein